VCAFTDLVSAESPLFFVVRLLDYFKLVDYFSSRLYVD